MSAWEFAEWLAYDRLEPIGEPRADMRIAMLTALTAEIHRNDKNRPAAFVPADFIPWFWATVATEAEADRGPDPGELWSKFREWAITAGAKKHDDSK